MKFLAIALTLTGLTASANPVVEQFGASQILNVTTDYSQTCIPTLDKTLPDDDLHVVDSVGTIVVTTTTGILKLQIFPGQHALWSNSKNPGHIVKRSAAAACASVSYLTREATDTQLSNLFDVKSAQVQSNGVSCYFKQLRVIHDGEKVSNYTYNIALVACP